MRNKRETPFYMCKPENREVNRMQTLSSFLMDRVEHYSTRPALLTGQGAKVEQWSYQELLNKARIIANHLAEQGVKNRDRVIIWAPNSPWWVATYFACHQIGAILVPIDIRSSKDFVNKVLAQSEATLAILSTQTQESWNANIASIMIENLEKLPDTGKPLPQCPTQVDDIALLMFTSGTTGDPKGVMLTHHNVLSNVDATNGIVPFLSNYRLMSLLPLSHMLEQTLGLLQPLYQGASVYYPASLQPNTLFSAMQQQHITIIILVPQVLQLFMDGMEREVKKQGKQKIWQRMLAISRFLPLKARRFIFKTVHKRLGGHLRYFVAGGAYLDPGLARKWNLLGVQVLQGYGLTEAAPVVTGTPLYQKDPASVGKVLPGIEIKFNEDNEILLRGATITGGYWHNEKATRDAFENGWFRTGDLGYLDKKGYLYLRGRKKDMIVLSNGKNVYPEDVEHALKQVPGIKEAVVVAYPEKPEPQVHAVLICDPEAGNPATLVKEANKALAPYQYIKGFTVWHEPEFPQTHTLKIKKREVIKELEALKNAPINIV